MAALVWDETGEREFTTGVDRGVLFPMTAAGGYGAGVAWNGLTAVNEAPSGGEVTALYADNIKYLNLMSAEEFKCTIEAYMFPAEFGVCIGMNELTTGIHIGQQDHESFGFSYRTNVGNDVEGTDYGYRIHLVYGCLAAPSQVNHQTIDDSPEANTFSFEVSTTPVNVEGFKPTATLVIDSTLVDADKLAAFEKTLYGDASTEAKLPLPDEVLAAFKATA